jgi:hypothetical protein
VMRIGGHGCIVPAGRSKLNIYGDWGSQRE